MKQNAFAAHAANSATRIPEAESVATQLATQDTTEPHQNARTFAKVTRQQDTSQANLQQGYRPINRAPFAAADCEFMKQTCNGFCEDTFQFRVLLIPMKEGSTTCFLWQLQPQH